MCNEKKQLLAREPDLLRGMPSSRKAKSFMFELTPNDSAPIGGSRTARGSNRNPKGRPQQARNQGSPAVRLAADEGGDWLEVDLDGVCEVVPQLPRATVLATCARERARGASVQQAIESLLALSLHSSEASSAGAAAAPRSPVAQRADATPLEMLAPAGATVLISELPDEVLAAILAPLGYAQVGRLALTSRDCLAAVHRWLCRVRHLRVSGLMRKWSDRRILSLVRASPELDALTVDCAPKAHSIEYT